MLILTDRCRQFVDLPALPPLWVVACAFALSCVAGWSLLRGISRLIALSGFPARAPVQEPIAGTPDVARLRANGLLRLRSNFLRAAQQRSGRSDFLTLSATTRSRTRFERSKLACLVDFVLILTDRCRQV